MKELPINQIIQGDCLEVLKTLPDNYVDSIVTDPPYGFSFMGKKWDYDVPSVEVCKSTVAKRYDWANLTGKYNDIKDFKRMCRSCHSKFNNKIKNITA